MRHPIFVVALVALASLGFASACSSDRHPVQPGASDGGGADARSAGTALAISGDEAVKRLTRFILNMTPNAFLMNLQNSHTVTTRVDVATLARQMLNAAEARYGVGAFYRWWLALDKVPTVTKDAGLFPQWTTEVAADAARETETFAVAVTLQMNGSFPLLMNGPFSYVNQRLAGLYGLLNVMATGTDLEKVNLDPGQRGGLLTQPALLAMNADFNRTVPTRRGAFVRDRFYCKTIAPPPGPAPSPPGMLPPNATGRQTVEAAVAAGKDCGSCHALLDPLGFAYEGFDPIGRVRTSDNGSPIDTAGKISNGAGADVGFNGPLDLAAILTGLDEVQTCLVRKWLSYGLARDLLASDEPTVVALHGTFKNANLDIRELILAIATSDVFLAP